MFFGDPDGQATVEAFADAPENLPEKLADSQAAACRG